MIRDWDDSFWGLTLKKGQVIRIISLGIYYIDDDKLKRIRTIGYRMINQWQLE